MEDTRARLERCAAIVAAEIEVLSLEQEITGKVRRKLEKTQKDYFLNEQLKEIQKELGTEGDDPTGASELEEKVKAKGLPAEVAEKCQKELKRLGRHAAHVPGVGAPAHVPGMDRGPPVEGDHRRQQGHRARPRDPGRRPLRPEEGQGADPRLHCGAPAHAQGEGPHPLLHRPPGHRARPPWAAPCPVPGQELRARFPGRRAGRSGDPGAQKDLRRRASRQDHPVHAQSRRRATRCSSWTRSTR